MAPAHLEYSLDMRITRIEVWQLFILTGLAILLTFALKQSTSLGVDVGRHQTVQDIRADHGSPTSDNTGADLTLIVFTDYLCPACRATYPEMKRALASDGKVRIVYKDWPIFGAKSERAAQIAVASSFQGIYPRVHDRLMTAPAMDDRSLRAAVEASGGDWRRLQVDLGTRRLEIEQQIARNKQQAFSLGLPGTPGFLIGPLLVRGGMKEREFREVLKKARSEGGG